MHTRGVMMEQKKKFNIVLKFGLSHSMKRNNNGRMSTACTLCTRNLYMYHKCMYIERYVTDAYIWTCFCGRYISRNFPFDRINKVKCVCITLAVGLYAPFRFIRFHCLFLRWILLRGVIPWILMQCDFVQMADFPIPEYFHAAFERIPRSAS